VPILHPVRSVPDAVTRPQNKLLATLPAAEYERLQDSLIVTPPLTLRQVLYKQGERIEDVYFPTGGACSLTKTMQDGQTAEVATIGSEGVVGAGVFFGDDLSAADTFVQVAGYSARKMSTRDFIAHMERGEALYNLVIRYSHALLTQVMQTAVCNGLHSAEQRCCRWLLMTRDRVGTNDLKLTQELLSMMLGLRRPTVTLVIHTLQRAGLIETSRAYIKIVNLAGLEARSCECYQSVKTNFHRLLPEISGATG
jgi:CRP-like cAMP-binding protein